MSNLTKLFVFLSAVLIGAAFSVYFWDDSKTLVIGLMTILLAGYSLLHKKAGAVALLNRYDVVRIGVIVSLTLLVMSSSDVVKTSFVSVMILVFTILFVLPFWPGLIKSLTNEPNQFRPIPSDKIPEGASQVEIAKILANITPYEPSTFALFTSLAPGEIKAIVRDRRFIRFIMRFAGKKFKGEELLGTDEAVPSNNREYWDVIDTPRGSEDSHPIPHTARKGAFDLIWIWSRFIYDLHGVVWTGVPPFQTVQVYKLDLLQKFINKGGEIEFVLKEDFSDQVRAAKFLFYIEIPTAETNDQVKVRIQLALNVLVVNPYRAFYDTDAVWAKMLRAAVIDITAQKIRGLPYKEVIAEDAGDKDVKSRRLSTPVLELNESPDAISEIDNKRGLEAIGLRIQSVMLLDAAVVDPGLAAALADVAKAKADAIARVLRGESEGKAIDMVAAAARKHGSYGQLALQIEGNVRTADAATKNGGDVILTVGSSESAVDPKTLLLRNSIEGGSQNERS